MGVDVRDLSQVGVVCMHVVWHRANSGSSMMESASVAALAPVELGAAGCSSCLAAIHGFWLRTGLPPCFWGGSDATPATQCLVVTANCYNTTTGNQMENVVVVPSDWAR